VLSPQLKREIRQLWHYFRSDGIADRLAAIEQITYLVFLKRLEDLQRKDLVIPEKCRWSNFQHLSGDALLKRVRGEVFDWLRSLDTDDPQAQESESESSQDDADKKMRQKHRGRMRDAVFLIPNATLLRRAIDTIDKLFIPSRNQDTLGDIYEHLLGEIAEDRENRHFRTPRHIIQVMCDLVNPQWNDRICDPACGTAGFLVNAYQHVIKTHTDPAN
jgi:type I restriction enzyme M protein